MDLIEKIKTSKLYILIDNFFSKDEQQEIDDLEEDMTDLKTSKENLESENKKLSEDISKLEAEKQEAINEKDEWINKYNKLLVTNDKHSTLQNYLNWLDKNIKPSACYHTTQNGNIRPHESLARITDKEKVLAFAETVITRNIFKNEDDLVYHFNVSFSSKYPTNVWYKTDSAIWGKSEYWETAEEVIDLIKNKRTFSDCDSVSFLKYWCMRLLLDKYYPEWDKRRLRVFLVSVNITGGGHALLAWIKEGPNDWIPIETTYFNPNFTYVWKGDYRIRDNNIAYDIWYSFDTEAEYKRI